MMLLFLALGLDYGGENVAGQGSGPVLYRVFEAQFRE
jgi:hypothetical protein